MVQLNEHAPSRSRLQPAPGSIQIHARQVTDIGTARVAHGMRKTM